MSNQFILEKYEIHTPNLKLCFNHDFMIYTQHKLFEHNITFKLAILLFSFFDVKLNLD